MVPRNESYVEFLFPQSRDKGGCTIVSKPHVRKVSWVVRSTIQLTKEVDHYHHKSSEYNLGGHCNSVICPAEIAIVAATIRSTNLPLFVTKP